MGWNNIYRQHPKDWGRCQFTPRGVPPGPDGGEGYPICQQGRGGTASCPESHPILMWAVLLSSPDGGGVPLGTPCQDWMGVTPQLELEGYPPLRLDRLPPPPHHQEIGRQSSYAAGSMPLAFTQEDFLV